MFEMGLFGAVLVFLHTVLGAEPPNYPVEDSPVGGDPGDQLSMGCDLCPSVILLSPLTRPDRTLRDRTICSAVHWGIEAVSEHRQTMVLQTNTVNYDSVILCTSLDPGIISHLRSPNSQHV